MDTLSLSSKETNVAEHIVREHEALRHKLNKIHTVLAERDPSSDEIETLLREFLNALVTHFANEEDDGFFQQVSAKAPRLASTAGRLSVEHRSLLHEAEELCRFAATGSPSIAWWRELNNRCGTFNDRLTHHECEENRMMKDAHRLEVGACD